MRCLQRRYRLDEPVGRGGMATVWRGYDLRLQRTVAVKLLSAPLLRREALAAARLDHPGVARVYDYGEQRHLTRTPTPFLVMEFVAGSTLAARLRAAGPLPPDETLRIGQQVAAALAAAHEQGIVHRDVKPGNIMLTESGVKVVDFGIAVGAGDDPAEPDGQLWGTPSYLPPELTAGAEAVPAGDVFALGVVLTECLTGQSPQRSPHEPVSVPDVGGLSASHAHLIGRCLAADPDRRPDAAGRPTRRRGRLHRAVPGTAGGRRTLPGADQRDGNRATGDRAAGADLHPPGQSAPSRRARCCLDAPRAAGHPPAGRAGGTGYGRDGDPARPGGVRWARDTGAVQPGGRRLRACRHPRSDSGAGFRVGRAGGIDGGDHPGPIGYAGTGPPGSGRRRRRIGSVRRPAVGRTVGDAVGHAGHLDTARRRPPAPRPAPRRRRVRRRPRARPPRPRRTRPRHRPRNPPRPRRPPPHRRLPPPR
ncbi:serine/threonine-protein kinase [Verrucosispora sioxanthis]|uniref:serine/threonine-protein kinase n=1 Tax=Verrucosispora sioxanthis TaxID=2499994 RepID=UPI001C1065E0|nr:serine/threonine-protein kinase [Verrucosispora sioxanthis]